MREAAPREVVPLATAATGYPSAAELVTSSGEWRRWLDEALRSVLGPVAVAGAIGIAAAGCGSGVATPPGIAIGEGAPSGAGAQGASAVLVPLGVSKPGSATGSKPGAGATGVTLASLGTPGGVQTTPPTTTPGNLNNRPGQTRPISHPIALPGRIAMPRITQPVVPQPIPDPPAMAGEPPMVQAVRPAPAPAPRRVPPIQPNPMPPRLGGDEASVDPSI